MKPAIIIMAKAPVAGTVKTRLEPFLTGRQCAALAECFLLDAVGKTKDLDAQPVIAYAPAGQRDFFGGFENHKIILCEQRGNDLGEKMYSAFQFAFGQNFDPVVMVGTDSPTLPPEFIKQAFEFLGTSAGPPAAVLGQTLDGGFYLIGLRQAVRKEIFENVRWSSPQTFSQTKKNILRLELNLKELPDWYDVDEPEDLKRLAEEFERNQSARETAPRTFKWMEENLWAARPYNS